MAGNIPVKNIYYMLSYAYRTLNQDGFQSLSAENFDNIHDLFAAILVKGVSSQIKRGLNKSYLQETEQLGCLRGKIDVTASVRQLTMMSSRMVCTYDEFSENTLLNQILKMAMVMLLRHGHVKAENKKALRKLLVYFNKVTYIEPLGIQWKTINYHKNNAGYKMLVNICWLLVKGLLQTTDKGEYRLSAFIDDQQMSKLYEKFVLAYYQKEHTEYSPKASHIRWDVDGECLFLPLMKSDIMLTYQGKTLIIDTKYYQQSMQVNAYYDSTSHNSNNLYQIFTYVKNEDKSGSGDVSGILLYAKTTEDITPDSDYLIGGNRIGVKALDLSLEWDKIKMQLDLLADTYLMS